MDGHNFLNGCYSKPLTIGDLKPGDLFVPFPDDGDDSGHGGFRGARRLLVKIEPYWPGKPYHESVQFTYKPYEGGPDAQLPLSYPVVKIMRIVLRPEINTSAWYETRNDEFMEPNNVIRHENEEFAREWVKKHPDWKLFRMTEQEVVK